MEVINLANCLPATQAGAGDDPTVTVSTIGTVGEKLTAFCAVITKIAIGSIAPSTAKIMNLTSNPALFGSAATLPGLWVNALVHTGKSLTIAKCVVRPITSAEPTSSLSYSFLWSSFVAVAVVRSSLLESFSAK